MPSTTDRPPGQLAGAMALMWGGLIVSSVCVLLKLDALSPAMSQRPNPNGLWLAAILNGAAVLLFAWCGRGLWRGVQARRRATWVIIAGATIWLGIPVAEELGAGAGVNGLNYTLVVAMAAMVVAARLLAGSVVDRHMRSADRLPGLGCPVFDPRGRTRPCDVPASCSFPVPSRSACSPSARRWPTR